MDLFPFLHKTKSSEQIAKSEVHLENYERLLSLYYNSQSRQRRLFRELVQAHKDELFRDNLKQDMCDVLGGLCLGTPTFHEIMFQFETNFFDLCGVGGHANIIWHAINESEDKAANGSGDDDDDDERVSPICAAVTTCHRVHYGHLLKELSNYFFLLPEPLIRERYIVFLLQSYCHVLTMTLEMLDVDWQKRFSELSFNKMVVAFFTYVPQAILQSVITHMELTDPEELNSLLANKTVISPSSVEGSKGPSSNSSCNNHRSQQIHLQKYIPLTPKRVHFLLSLMNPVHKSV